jgi:hypothetical protein
VDLVHIDVHWSLAIIWDGEKLKANIEKHGVRFRDVVPVLEDPSAITINDYESGIEERFVTLGLDALISASPGGGLCMERQRHPIDFSAPRKSP